jgi:RNA polymerase sigma-70 factor (ECF subfamily)
MDARWSRRDGPEEARALDGAVRDAQAGDPRAFERIVARFREPLTAYATALLRDRGYAEDAVQEAFVHAFRHLRRLRSPALLRPWLYAILENCALSAWRSRRRRRTFALGDGHAVAEGDEAGGWGPPPLPGEEAPPPPEPSPAYRAVRASFEALPEPYGRALALHYLEGLSTAEVARALGLSLNNAKVRLFRARNALRRELRARGVDGPRRRGAEAAS